MLRELGKKVGLAALLGAGGVVLWAHPASADKGGGGHQTEATPPGKSQEEHGKSGEHGKPVRTPVITEDNDTNDGNTPNNVVDSDDNAHPSGKDRSVEHGNSGNQGKSPSDPDGAANGGPDKPNGSGGVDKADQDGNNGCGNDDDFEDDNNGNCRHRKIKPPVVNPPHPCKTCGPLVVIPPTPVTQVLPTITPAIGVLDFVATPIPLAVGSVTPTRTFQMFHGDLLIPPLIDETSATRPDILPVTGPSHIAMMANAGTILLLAGAVLVSRTRRRTIR